MLKATLLTSPSQISPLFRAVTSSPLVADERPPLQFPVVEWDTDQLERGWLEPPLPVADLNFRREVFDKAADHAGLPA